MRIELRLYLCLFLSISYIIGSLSDSVAKRNRAKTQKCSQSHGRQPPPMDVYWINMEHAYERRRFMHRHLNFYGLDVTNRVSAMTPRHIHVPDGYWPPKNCVTHLNQTLENMEVPSLSARGLKALILSLCGRKQNTKLEIAVTLSHLKVMAKAIYEGNSSNPYVLVLEDDLQFSLEVDFQGLIDSAPKDFGILQLVTSNDFSVLNLWRVYNRHKLTWVRRKDHDDYWCTAGYIMNKSALKPHIDMVFQHLPKADALKDKKKKRRAKKRAKYGGGGTAGTGSRHREVEAGKAIGGNSGYHHYDDNTGTRMNTTTTTGTGTGDVTGGSILVADESVNVAAEIITSSSASSSGKNPLFDEDDEWIGVHMVTGYQGPRSAPGCGPHVCCDSRGQFRTDLPCVNAARGYAADNYLYNIPYGNAYMLTMPIMSGAVFGNKSSLHQDHVDFHARAFRRMDGYIEEMLSGTAILPPFLNAKCIFNRSATD